jgi:hypothetical protein
MESALLFTVAAETAQAFKSLTIWRITTSKNVTIFRLPKGRLKLHLVCPRGRGPQYLVLFAGLHRQFTGSWRFRASKTKVIHNF